MVTRVTLVDHWTHQRASASRLFIVVVRNAAQKGHVLPIGKVPEEASPHQKFCIEEEGGHPDPVWEISAPKWQSARRSKHGSTQLKRGKERVATAGQDASGAFPIGTCLET